MIFSPITDSLDSREFTMTAAAQISDVNFHEQKIHEKPDRFFKFRL